MIATGRMYSPNGSRSCSDRARTSGSVGYRERQLVDDHAAKAVTGDVDALPEAARGEEDGARVGEEALEDLAARAVHTLGQARDPPRVEAILKKRPDALERPIAREEHEGMAVELACDAVDERGHLHVVDRIVVGGRILGQDADRLAEIVERRRQGQLLRCQRRCRPGDG